MNTASVLKDLKRIEASLAAVILQLEAENAGVKATVAEVRKAAVLEEVYRAGGKVTPGDLSRFSEEYGKTPSSSAGYFSGKAPSMTVDQLIAATLLKPNWFTGTGRYLTGQGLRVVLEKREAWGDDWLDRIPREILKSQVNALSVITF